MYNMYAPGIHNFVFRDKQVRGPVRLKDYDIITASELSLTLI